MRVFRDELGDWVFVCAAHLDAAAITFSWENAMEAMHGHSIMRHGKPAEVLDSHAEYCQSCACSQ